MMCAWDLIPGRQDGRRRLIQWAIAAPLNFEVLLKNILIQTDHSAKQRFLKDVTDLQT